MSAVMSSHAVGPPCPRRSGPAVSAAVLGDAVSDLHCGLGADSARWEPFADEDRRLVNLGREGEGVRGGGDGGGHVSPIWGELHAQPTVECPSACAHEAIVSDAVSG